MAITLDELINTTNLGDIPFELEYILLTSNELYLNSLNNSNNLVSTINSINTDTIIQGTNNRFIVNDIYNRNITFTNNFISPFTLSFIMLPLSLKLIISLSSMPSGTVTYIVSCSKTLLPFSIVQRSISSGTVALVKTCSIAISIFFIIGVGFCSAC